VCEKEVVNLNENLLSILVQRVEEIFPALKDNMVSVLCMIGIVSSFLIIAGAGVFDLVPRQNQVMCRSVSCHWF
jgi:hypothetical protein